METLTKGGRFFFAASIAGFGMQYLTSAALAAPAPGPPWTPGSRLWAYVTGAFLIAVAVSIATKKSARVAAFLLGSMFFLRVLLIHGPRLAVNLHDPGPWTTTFEVLAMCGAALVLAGTLPVVQHSSQRWESAVDKTAVLGRFLFAISLVIFGIQHLMYARFVASLVPSWIPGHLFWAYFTGAAFIAATMSIITGKSARLAATLLGLMFLLWVLLLHLPRVALSPHNGNEWTSAFVALAMCGGAFVLARTFGKDESRPAYV